VLKSVRRAIRMTTDEILHMCQRLARKYKNRQEYNDLVQEGFLACLEALEKNPEAYPARLYWDATTRIHYYANFNNLPVRVPKSGMSVKMSRNRGMSDEELKEGSEGWTDEGIRLLRVALDSESVELDKLDEHELSSESLIIKAEFSHELNKRLSENLTENEQIMVFMLFEEGMTKEECGDFFGISRQAFTKREEKLLDKIRAIVADMQHP
jgi:RNA polymerase sigma factor (sigma-70 family)